MNLGFLGNLGLGDAVHLPQLTGVVGASRNAKINVNSASSIATFTADELIVETALSGVQYKLTSFNQTMNLAQVGAGGMDIGTAPTAGYIALYAIYNPTIQASALLAIDSTSAKATEIYSGTHMPSGYIASALVSVWRITSGQLVPGYQMGRTISIGRVSAMSSTVQQLSPIQLSLAGLIPQNANYVSGDIYITTSGGSTVGVNGSVGGAVSSIGSVNFTQFGTISNPFYIPIITSQSLFYTMSVISGNMVSSININGYKI